MQEFLSTIYEQASARPVRIVFSEGSDDRVLDAVKILANRTSVKPILIGNPDEIRKKLEVRNVDLNSIEIINNDQNEYLSGIMDEYREELNRGQDKSVAEIEQCIGTPHVLGTFLVKKGMADGMVTGATHSTGESIKPALKFIPKKEKFQKVSGTFFMKLEDRILLFADTAVTIEPEVMDLVDIAEDTVETAKKFGIEPRVAFLSFSTKNSSDNLETDKMERAAKIFKEKHPEIPSDGEFQADAALVPDVAKRKAPESEIQGDATILIFPDLNSANISYKLVERLAKARAIGPVLQGLTKPINDLSRGCSAQDIADIAVITAVEAITED